MTIKHYAGYGRVSAKRIKDDATLHVRVSGNHEHGLYRDDLYDLYNWLVKRFDKTVPASFAEWYRAARSKYDQVVEIHDDYETAPDGKTEEVCDYRFFY